MKISYNWLKDYLKNLPKPEKLADLLTIHSFEVEGIEKVGKDYVLNIDVLPNRAHDCLSHIGVARECSALLNTKLQITKPKLKEFNNLKVNDFIKVEVKDNEACLRYNARLISNIKVRPSPKWLKQRLEVLNQKPINNIVDVTNYVMFETGQPLHAFDYDKIEGKKIIVRKARKGEKIITLDGEKCDLDEDILVIADVKSALALAGVKGGKKAEISNKTKTIVLESANFDIHAVRATSRKTGLRTESSLRFEYGLDPNLTSQAIDRVAGLIQEIAGGKTAKGIIDVYPKKIFPQKLKLNLNRLESILGIKVSKEEIIKNLKLLGFEVDNALKVVVPTFRQDVKIEEDLIEEIARLIGYEKIPAKPPLGILVSPKRDDVLRLKNKIQDILESLGLTEVYNYSFVGEGDLKKFGISLEDYIEIENPLSLDLKYLRKDLITNLLKNIRDNFRYFDEVRLFELGKVYLKNEKMMLTGIIGRKGAKDELFYEIKRIVDGLLNKLGIAGQWYDDFEQTPEWGEKNIWHPKLSAEIKLDNQEIGFLGEIDPEILSKFGIKGQVAAFNLDFELLIKLVSEELIYQPPSLYPAAVRDLAVLVNRGDRVADVLNVINEAGGDLVQDVDLFDMYEGEEIPNNKKNLAFHIIYQSYEKTLKDEEVDKIQRRIVRALERRKGWEVRR